MHRIYPQHVKRQRPLPDWAKIPFVQCGPPPAMFFTIAGAKAIARHEWSRRFGNVEPSDDAIKKFVFGFHWRWRGDHPNRYKVVARWAYEFAAETKKQLAGSEAQEKNDATVDKQTGSNTEMAESVAYEIWWDDEPHTSSDSQKSLPVRSDRPALGKLQRFILLNPRLPKTHGRPRKQ